MVLRDQEDGTEYIREKVDPGDEIIVHWRHSVERTIWEEKLKVEKDQTFTLTETRFQSFGAGVPNEKEGNVSIKDGYVVMDDLNETKPAYYWFHSQLAELTVYKNGKELLLPDDIPHHHKVEMIIEKG
ncbi:putative transport protein [Bacillus freudenreichii]|nr:putative transport protein [Bacillus freudenreichii]